jgi:hypothetical protein
MSLKALAVIPWKAADDWRVRLMEYVTAHLERAGVEYILSPDPQPGPFNRARAKNFGAEIAIGKDYDIIIFHDADMVIHDWEYENLIYRADEFGQLVIGFNEYRALTAAGTSMLLSGQLVDPWQVPVAQATVSWSLGGIIAMTTAAYEHVGGYDERFRGWGCEDTAFAVASGVALDGKQRLEGSACHLWHEHASGYQTDEDNIFNAALLARYNQIVDLATLRDVQTID